MTTDARIPFTLFGSSAGHPLTPSMEKYMLLAKTKSMPMVKNLNGFVL
jgi:hypothetical protein